MISDAHNIVPALWWEGPEAITPAHELQEIIVPEQAESRSLS